MKLQISFNLTDLKEALSIASQVEEYCDSFEVGSLLITQHGMHAIQKFRAKFPEKTIVCDSKIVEHEKDMVTLAADAGSDWVTVLAGASQNTIHNTCTMAKKLGKKVFLDLIDASSFGQVAVEAESLGVDALLFHKVPAENSDPVFLDDWDMVQGNTDLPIYISTLITRDNVYEIVKANPYGIVIGYAITSSENPKETAAHFHGIIKK